ncbi:conidial development fluffy [Fusarium beomiforme]|uniref:Conidial development fluffy n=1 Tax=Fusarium beomiforme TaxID=44412 RepID=A0A9P5AKI6_9HYPO|nr:conidial development fluffy [Fusarium beomiforme]
MDRKHRHILPSTIPCQQADTVPTDSLERLTPKRRRPLLNIACEHCRIKKTACDGQRPSCQRCLRWEVPCLYRPVKRPNAGELLARHEEFVNHLRLLPEKDAIHLLHRLRLTADAEAFIKSIEGGAAPSLLRPSDIRTARWTGPPAQTATEFELMTRHQATYLKVNPVEASFLERLVDMSPSQPRSPLPTATASVPDELASGTESRNKEPQRSSPLHSISQRTLSFPRPVASNSTPRSLCDKRLADIQVDYWTRVPITNAFAAAALSHYLEKDHMIMDFFDANVVIDDLVTCGSQFCTSFFVSSLMFVACSYTLVDVTAAPMAICFFKEAEMLLEGEETVDSVTTVAALMLFGHASVCYGKDVFGQRLLDTGQRMGERLGLFGVSKEDPLVRHFRSKPVHWRAMASHTAWGAFNYFALFNSFYPREPIRYPPVLPMPGKVVDNMNPIMTKESVPSVPRHSSPYFHTQCRLWVIALEVVSVYKQPSNVPISERVPIAFVEAKYRRLVACMDELGENGVRGGDYPAHVLILYIYFNVIVLNILHPFIQEASTSANLMRSFAAPDSNPKTIYAASVNQLKQLTLWYYLRDGKSMSIWINPGFLVLVGALLRDEGTVDLSQRLYVLLCIRCCANLYVAYPIFLDIAKAFLAMALQRKAVSGNEASNLLAYIRQHGAHHADLSEVVSNTLVDADLASTAPDKAAAHALAELFEDLSLFDQFTTGEYIAHD